MGRIGAHRRTARASCVAATTAVAVALAGCGTPGVVKPVTDPLPGFSHDISAAQNAVSQSQQEAQAFGSTNVSAP
jgi:hypothetical protein